MHRNPALDGLRTVAIAMVIAYHVDKSIVPAGFWGVIVFFVLSGYLITRSLAAEMDRTGRIDFGSYYLKRGLRLYPALLVLCLVLLAAGTDWSQVVPTLGYYANYARVAGQDLDLLTHTWFLAVMAHFYLVWPLAMIAIPAERRVRALGFLTLAAIAWRVLAIGVLSPGWVYNATDANAAALLAGCYLGVARPRPWRLSGWSIPALLGLMLLPVFGEQGSALLWGGFVALALGVLAVQYAETRPAWLETRVVVWVGTVSYGLYLWHYVFVRSDIPLWTAVPLTLATVTASWYLLEKPLLRWFARFDDRPPERDPEPATPDRADVADVRHE